MRIRRSGLWLDVWGFCGFGLTSYNLWAECVEHRPASLASLARKHASLFKLQSWQHPRRPHVQESVMTPQGSSVPPLTPCTLKKLLLLTAEIRHLNVMFCSLTNSVPFLDRAWQSHMQLGQSNMVCFPPKQRLIVLHDVRDAVAHQGHGHVCPG